MAQVEIIDKKLVTTGAGPEDLAEMHESALARLVENQPDITLKVANQKVALLFMELFMAYGLATRQQVRLGQIVMEALKTSEEKFHTITDMVHDAIIMMDSVGRVTYWNTAAERIFGYRKQEITGREFHPLIVPDCYHDAFYKGFKKFEKSGADAAIGNTLELAGIRKGGEQFPVELSLSAVKLKGQWNAIGIIRDITNRKQAADKLKDSHRQYRLLSEQLEDSNSLKELLLDIITHNLKNPTGNIRNAAEILQEELSGHDLVNILREVTNEFASQLERGADEAGIESPKNPVYTCQSDHCGNTQELYQ